MKAYASGVKLRTPEMRARLNRMSQGELAKRAGLSKSTISNLESGRLKRIELATIAKLCRALSCSPNDLFDIPWQQEFELMQRQRATLKKVLGSIDFEKPISPGELDIDLSNVVDNELKRSGRKAKKRSA